MCLLTGKNNSSCSLEGGEGGCGEALVIFPGGLSRASTEVLREKADISRDSLGGGKFRKAFFFFVDHPIGD